MGQCEGWLFYLLQTGSAYSAYLSENYICTFFKLLTTNNSKIVNAILLPRTQVRMNLKCTKKNFHRLKFFIIFHLSIAQPYIIHGTRALEFKVNTYYFCF